MASSDSCSCTWKLAGQQPVQIPVSQLSVPVLSQHYVRVRVSAGIYYPIVVPLVEFQL